MKHGACSNGKISKTWTAWRYIRSKYPNEICKKWEDFSGFFEDLGDAPDGYHLERINRNSKYSKSNCEWADKRPIDTGYKTCIRCKIKKKHEEFIKNQKMHFGVGSYCINCFSLMDKERKNIIKKRKKDLPKNKKCSVCGETKQMSDFVKNASSTDGLTSECKKCRKIKKKIYRARQKKKFEKNGVTVKEKTCCVCHKIKQSSEFYEKKTEAVHLRPECKECSTKLFAKSRKNINFKIAMNLRERLRQALKGKSKNKKTLEYLGCNIEYLKKHLESKFTDGMSWKNYGYNGWHIDHIKPISLFDLTKDSEIKKACHYTNLQPLWAKDNMSKGAKYEE